MKTGVPAIIISGLSGGSGKTLCAMGLAAALKARGLRTVAFKKGPDFIDPAWLARATGTPCRNLDVFLMGEKQVKASFLRHGRGSDICVIEGNRGLFDGLDKKGTYSTANLARLIGAKVILILDCTKMTGTAAALVLGCLKFDPKVNIAGVILNRAGGARHAKVVRDAIAFHTRVPVVGVIPKLRDPGVLERHLGLLPPAEHRNTRKIISQAGQIAEKYLDIKKIIRIAGARRSRSRNAGGSVSTAWTKRVGVIRDKAFNFYYPENLEALRARGAKLVFLNALRDKSVPDLDLLYIGGGFPETQARFLAKNVSFRKSLKRAVENGLRVYAECGGVVYLGRRLRYRGSTFPMTGVFPVDFSFSERPKGHGYSVLKINGKNPFFRVGTVLKGHEFHYTGPAGVRAGKYVAAVKRGFGFDGRRDGLVYKNVLALYTHLHALGTGGWAASAVPT